MVFSFLESGVCRICIYLDCNTYLLFLGIRFADKGSNGVAFHRGQNTIVFGVLKESVVIYYCPVEHLNVTMVLDLFAA